MAKPDPRIREAALCQLNGDQAGWRRHYRRLRARYKPARLNSLLSDERARLRAAAAQAKTVNSPSTA